MPISQFSAIQPLFVQCHPAHARESYTQAILFIQHKSLIIHNLIRNNSRASFLTALALPGIMRAISFSGLLTMKFMEWKYIHFGGVEVHTLRALTCGLHCRGVANASFYGRGN